MTEFGPSSLTRCAAAFIRQSWRHHATGYLEQGSGQQLGPPLVAQAARNSIKSGLPRRALERELQMQQ